MGNKKDPRKVMVTDVPTMLTCLATRKSVVFRNEGANDVALGRYSDVTTPLTFAAGFPFKVGEIWPDVSSVDQYWAICNAGLSADIWVWETE